MVFLGESQPAGKKALAVYPIFLFYFVISWMVLSHTTWTNNDKNFLQKNGKNNIYLFILQQIPTLDTLLNVRKIFLQIPKQLLTPAVSRISSEWFLHGDVTGLIVANLHKIRQIKTLFNTKFVFTK